MTVEQLRRRLAELSVLANGARANGVELPKALDEECLALAKALATVRK